MPIKYDSSHIIQRAERLEQLVRMARGRCLSVAETDEMNSLAPSVALGVKRICQLMAWRKKQIDGFRLAVRA